MFKKSGSLLRNVPDIPVLQQLLDKCFQARGEKLQVYWRNTENQLFILEVVCSLKDGRPYWQLIRERSGRRTMIAEYTGHDILLVYKQISTATADAQEERASDESNRVSRTRNARAAAATWLEGKQGPAEKSEEKLPSAAQAAEESPWAVTPAIARQDNDSWPPVPAVQNDPAYQFKSQDEQRTPQAPPAASKNSAQNSGATSQNTVHPPLPDLFPTYNSARVAPTANKTGTQQNISNTPVSGKPPAGSSAKSSGNTAGGQTSSGSGSTGSGSTSNTLPAIKKNPLAHPDKAGDAPVKRPGTSAPAHNQESTKSGAFTASSDNLTTPNLGKAALPTSGNLSDTSIVKLLKQLKVAQVTARLEFNDEQVNAFVFIEDGKPVEAWMGELKGDSALLEILLLASGQYTMMIGMTPINRNVKTSPEVLLEHNRNIALLLNELTEEGLTPDSTFRPSNAKLSSDEFNALATPDAPMELEKLASVFIKLDGKKTLGKLNELQVLSRPLLIQAIHHLYFNNLIDIVNPPPPVSRPVVVPKAIDGAAIQSVMLSLRRVDTGLFIYPAFLYFLEEEFYRIYRAKGAMTILIFEMREIAAGDGLVRRVSLPSEAIADATMRMSKCKRHTDIMAHYELHDFAILLPSTASGGARVFANKVIKTLTQTPLTGTAGKKLSFSFGGASMPEDFRDVPSLLGAAELAMTQARQRGKPLVMFKDVEF
ncbi:MAG: diguanylate cyclase [Cyanobacteria bacterium REEB67]|nr:diguanylate cyclase [Cyanobacteria bacterium REEB67]